MKKFLSTAGFIDPLSLITLGFLVVGLLVTTSIVKNPNISLDIRNYAKPIEEAFLKKPTKDNIKTSNVNNPPANNSNTQPKERIQKDDIEQKFMDKKLKAAVTRSSSSTTPTTTQTTPTTSTPINNQGLNIQRKECSLDHGTWDSSQKECIYPKQTTVDPPAVVATPQPSTNPFANITTGVSGGTIPEKPKPTPTPKAIVPSPAVNPRTGQPLAPTKTPTPTSNTSLERFRCGEQGGDWINGQCQSSGSTPTTPDKPVKKEEHFPIGVYYSANSSLTQAPPYSQESFNYLSQKGITDLILQNTGGSPQELLNFAKKSDLNVTLDLNFLLDKNNQLNHSLTSQIAQYPNLTGWYGLDEPTNDKTNSPLFPNNQNNLYNNLNKIAPDKPITTVYLPTIGWNNTPDNVEYLQPAMDFANQFNQQTNTQIIGTDPYYWSSGYAEDQVYQNVANVVQRTNSGQFGSTPEQVIAVLSAHSDLPRLQESFNYQATSAVVAGAAGIYYWDWPPGCNEVNCPGFKGNPSQTGYSAHIDKISQVANNLTAAESGITGNTYFLNQNNDITYRLNQADNGQVYAFAISNSGDITPSYTNSNTPLINQNQLNQIQQNSQTATTLFGLPPNTNFDIVGSKENLTSNNYGQLNLDAYVMANYILKEANLQPPSFNFNFPFLSVFCLYNPADSRCY